MTIGLVLVVSGLVSVSLAVAPVPQAIAATGADFDPGFIISDEIFYNSTTMTVAQIQSFLNSQVSSCRSGYTCLKDYRQSTTSQSAKSEGCSAYTGQANESAALIIYKVATACNVNPQAIVVLLEKEQGLVTDSWPTSRQYRSATGFGCPDTADCDATFYGFFNQVYQAAYMFKKYQARPLDRGYIAGRWNTIKWHPDSACGTSSVYIQNQATAGLYVYTPYRPNAAALANLYGTGDACSAYGNRNFWLFFTDWFGSTGSYAVAPALASVYSATGGATGILGPPTDKPVSYPDGGVGQEFSKGWAYWHTATGAYRTADNIGWSYISLRGPTGVLGYPIANPQAEPNSGASQAFQNGWLYYSPTTSIHVVSGPIGKSYDTLGGPAGVLGFPIAAANAEPDGGSSQAFQNGSLYWSPTTSIHRLSGVIGDSYAVLGGPGGLLGYPIAAQKAEPSGGLSQAFQKGTLYWSPTLRIQYVLAPLNAGYLTVGGVGGAYGHPIGSTVIYPDGGLGQQFENGWLYWSGATGLDAVVGVIGDSYFVLGGPGGLLGYPIAAQKAEPDGGLSQAFQNGWLVWSSVTSIDRVAREIGVYYYSVGGPGGTLGYPLDSTMVVRTGVLEQAFQGGRVRWTQAGGAVRY